MSYTISNDASSSSARPILVTGAAGFIGFHTSLKLLHAGEVVVGLDNFNDYYDVGLKRDRARVLAGANNLSMLEMDLADMEAVLAALREINPKAIIHLAAQPGVRYSLINPAAYGESNLTGFLTILEGARALKVDHLVYASSSSVYGANAKVPYGVSDPVDRPMSLYAATKRANEMMAQSYSHLFDLPATGLRFFTVYGPWGRPDMAVYAFTKAIEAGTPIKVFNRGKLRRDFTYVDDIVDGVVSALASPPNPGTGLEAGSRIPAAPHKIYNIGNNQPVELLHMIETLEACLGKKAVRDYVEMQPGDVFETYADIDETAESFGFSPSTSIEAGLEKFVAWYRDYHKAA
ncbi:MAG: NAD-dependent epimerase/dehydratase family protein [Pseudomonadota bacterium]